MPIKNRFAELEPEIRAWRQEYHRFPELMFDTHRTAASVAERLRAFGCDEVVEGLGRTGVVGIIRGRDTTSGRTVGLRADMDALPILEATGVPYASETPGQMHACGHDGHTSVLLGAAKYLAETRAFNGTVALIFQPAEEGGGGGREMIEDGILDRWSIDEVYAMHNWPGMAPGRFAIRSGPFFAATDWFKIEIEGKGGHAAQPQNAIDPTVIGAQIVVALQTIVSRTADPAEHIVCSITSFRTESNAYNVIPPRVELRGTVRTMDAGLRDRAQDRVMAITQGIAATFGGAATVTYNRGYPPMVNAEAETEYARDAAIAVSGGCDEAGIFMGGEDFAYFLEARPGAYILVGNGDSAPLHHPKYDFNDDTIPAACAWFVEVAERRMPLG